MGQGQQKVDKVSLTRRFLDKRQNPWEYVDEELPTTTLKLFSRKKQGTVLDSSSGLTNMGSVEFSGSFYELNPGTYSYRVTRRSVHIGSAVTYTAEIEWKLRHSREGTVDIIPFYLGTQQSNRRAGIAERRTEARGGPMEPIYSFGPGTLWTYFNPRRGTVRVYSSLEVIVS